ncbi:MAG: hypothetical protein LC114_18430 [Bryobacterales bacterium]|nr:hypothetical protein [Bryobacterales bacterium]
MILSLLCAMNLFANETVGPWTVSHERAFWFSQQGVLAAGNDGIQFTRASKKNKDEKPLLLRWDDIQQLTLADRKIEIVTYHDVVWQLGRDRILRFRLEGKDTSFWGMAPVLRNMLGERMIDALWTETTLLDRTAVHWQIPAKKTGLIKGVEGSLIFTPDELIFNAEPDGESRAWPLATIETIAQTGPLSLTVTAPERALSDEGGYRSFLFQLKQPLRAEQYQELWRAIERAHGTRLRFRDIE